MMFIRGVLIGMTLILLSGCVSSSRDTTRAPVDLREAASYNVQLGLEYLNQGRRDLAMEKLTRAVEQDSRFADAHLAIAYAYNQYGETQLADRHYRQALGLEPNNPNLQNTYGAFLCQHRDLRNAERQFVTAARNPTYNTPEVAWTNAGICVEQVPDLEAAENYYREALRINARHADALWQLSKVSFERSNPLQARAFLQRYLEVSPRSAESMWLGYQVERTLGDEQSAQQYANRLREDFGNTAEARWLEDAERGRGH